MRLTRREALLAAAAVTLVGCGAGDEPDPTTAAQTSPSATTPPPAEPAPPRPERLRLGDLEREFDARLGVYGLDTGTGREVVFHPDERFAFCSTHKALAAGALLRHRTLRELREPVPIPGDDLVFPSTITEQHVGGTLTWLQLADAAVRYSDNAAANLILAELGGPAGFQRELRSIGDTTTRSDRDEPELSTATPGDRRDTTTPRALATGLQAYALGDLLPPRKRALLTDWLKRNTTGDALIRSVAPTGWTVGDKTGAGGYGTRNDVAILWPPTGAPIVLAVMSRRDAAGPDAERDDRLIAAAAQRAIAALRA